MNSQLFMLLTKSLNEQYTTNNNNNNNTINEINNLKFSLLTHTSSIYENYLIDQFHCLFANTNLFTNIVKIIIYKTNPTSDSLVFILCKKISQLTPRLFGSLFNNESEICLFYQSIFDRFNTNNSQFNSQTINSMCEFLCATIEFQPTFFQHLASIIIKKDNTSNEITYAEGDQSIFKYIFQLLDSDKTHLKVNLNKILIYLRVENCKIHHKTVKIGYIFNHFSYEMTQ